MEFERQRKKLDLQTNPITYALGQIVIAPVLNIESFVPELQEVFRKSGYPLFEKQIQQSITFGQGGPQISESKKDVFLSPDRSRSLSVAPNQLILEVNSYTNFEQFLDHLILFSSAVKEIVQPHSFQRVGFRRINLIEEAPAMEALGFIRAGMRGLSEAGSGSHGYEFRSKLPDDVHRVIRSIHPAPNTGLPQDLASVPVPVKQPLTSGGVLLDIDHFLPESREFEKDQLVRQFELLHAASDEGFRASVADEAIAYWKGAP